MAKILVGINTLTVVQQTAYSNHMQFFFRCGRSTTHDYILVNPRRMGIDRMRNMCGRIVAENPDIDYLLFIDDDVLVPFDVVDRLIACASDIAAGHTLIRGYPFKNMFFKYVESSGGTSLTNYQEPVLNDKGLIECDAIGFSCALIRGDLIRKMTSPWFVTGGNNTEDIYFCIKAAKEFPETTIVVDPKIITAHILDPEAITADNLEPFKKYMELTRDCTHAEDKNPRDAEFPTVVQPSENTIGYDELIDQMTGSVEK